MKALVTLLSNLLRPLFANRIARVCFRFLVRFSLISAAFCTVWVAAYRFINPPITSLMIMEKFRVDKLEYEWRPLEQIAPGLQYSVIAAEDSSFCTHRGFDLDEIYKAYLDEDRRRGGSTITQQTAKNAFLWPDASWLRKGLEAGFTILVELFWPKTRILEVYLNIAEFDAGVFGAEAAAQHYFGVTAESLTSDQSARLAYLLPSPRRRDAGNARLSVVQQIRNDVAFIEHLGDYDCLRQNEGQ